MKKTYKPEVLKKEHEIHEMSIVMLQANRIQGPV